jgi:hypothetical protein
MRSSCRLLLAPFVMALVSGCVRDITEGGADVQILRGVVYGTVSSEDGMKVPGVGVEVRPDPNGSCPAQEANSPNVATIQASTGADGTFRAEAVLGVGIDVSVRATCVRLDVTSIASSDLMDTSASVGPLRFAKTVTDSVRADIVLQPR